MADGLWPWPWAWLLCAAGGPAREESAAIGRTARRRRRRRSGAFLVVVVVVVVAAIIACSCLPRERRSRYDELVQLISLWLVFGYMCDELVNGWRMRAGDGVL